MVNKTNEFTYVITPDGYQIATWVSVSSEAKAIVVLCHGITVDSTEGGFFIDFEKKLLSNDFGTIRFDFRCHGESEGEPKELTLYGEYLDLMSVIDYAKSKFNLPFILLATSFSCSAVIRNISERKLLYNGVILWNPIANYQKTFLEPSTPWVEKILKTSGDLTLPQWAYAQIPNTAYFITKKMVHEFEFDKTHMLLHDLKLPAIGFHGNNDTKIPYIYLKDIAERNSMLEFHLLDGEDHGFKTKRDYVVEKTISWIQKVVK